MAFQESKQHLHFKNQYNTVEGSKQYKGHWNFMRGMKPS
jgi:hypothetical protein